MLKLTPDFVGTAYDLLRYGPVFRRMRLPVAFMHCQFDVMKGGTLRGFYEHRKNHSVPHRIGLHQPYCTTLEHTLETLAHEMIHMHQQIAGTASPRVIHNAEFKRIAKRVCDAYGFPFSRFI